MSTLLLVANNEDDRYIITYLLRRAAIPHDVTTSKTLNLQELTHQRYKLVLLVTTIVEGMHSLHTIVQQSAAPVLVVCEAMSEDQIVNLLDAGAVAIMQRPYSATLLIAQIRALLRYQHTPIETAVHKADGNDLTLLPTTRTVRIRQTEVSFTRREFTLLQVLFVHRNQILTTDQLIEAVWGFSGTGDKNMLRNLINRLRTKLESIPHHTHRIITVPGTGYLLEANKPTGHHP